VPNPLIDDRDVDFLLDAFYDEAEAFEQWIEEDPDSFAPDAGWRRRFGSFYTGGSPQTHSVALADAVAPSLPAGVLVDDRTTRTWTDADHAHGVAFKRSGMGHDALVRWYFGRVVGASELPDAE
jgi:hypothetical protein